jgi:Tfp pilus assembly protein PilV
MSSLRAPMREAGFTLLEVLVAAVLLVVAMVGSIGLILGMASTNMSNRTRDVAQLLAQSALEQLSAVPLINLANNSPAATSAPSAPTCFGMSDDAVIDRPIPCPAGAIGAYYLRTWTCCTQNPAALPPYVVLPPAVPITGAQCNVAINNQPAGQLVSPNQVNGGVTCLIEAEVTWPHEDPVNGPATTTQAPGYFVDPQTTPPVTLPPHENLAFNNHVFATVVREQ